MTGDKTKKVQQLTRQANALEALKDTGQHVKKTAVNEIKREIPNTALEQILGSSLHSVFSGEIRPGQSINISEELDKKRSPSPEKTGNKFYYHEQVVRQEQEIVASKTNELRMQLKAIMEEVVILTSETGELGEELQIAAMQAPINPGEYHLGFFDQLLSFIKSFRKKVKDASAWMHVSNKRAQKKNYWSQYKKHGAKLLLSGESYSQRSAG
jgi:hypothetical protein